MGKKIAVMSTGAIGSSVGADLAQAGEDVWLIDQWPAHVEAMKAKGLRIQMTGGELHVSVRALHLCEVAPLKETFDIVFLCAKSPDSEWMAQFIKPHLAADGVLVCLNNSINDEWVAPIIGYQRDVAAVVELAAELWHPGVVKRHTDQKRTWFALGEMHGRVTPRVEELQRILSTAGRTEIKPNIWGGKWSKLSVNSMSMAVSAILRISDWEISQMPDLLELSMRLGRECLRVGKAAGYQLEPIIGMTAEEIIGASDEALKRTLLTLFSHIGQKSINAMLQDLERGRPTEVRHLNGLVAAKGRAAGVPTPLNDEIVRIVEDIEGRRRPFGRENRDLLESLVNPKRA